MAEITVFDSTKSTLLHIKRVNELLGKAAIELIQRGIVHDESKLGELEREYFDKYTPLLAKSEYGSPEYKENIKGLGPALLHHYANNSHHPEHYEIGINGMNLFDLLEMFLDWKAASERHESGDINRSIEINCDRFGIDPQLAQILINTIPFFDKK